MQQFSAVLLTMSEIIKLNSSEKAFKLHFLKLLLQPPSSLTFTPVSLCILLFNVKCGRYMIVFLYPSLSCCEGIVWFWFALCFKL